MGNSRKALVLALMVLAPSLFAGVLVSGQAEGQVMLALPPNVGWQNGTIDSGGAGSWPSIAVDGDGHVHVSYYDYNHGGVKYASDESGVWAARFVQTGATVGDYTSIAADGQGKSYISYHDSGNNDLRYATNADGTWKNSTVDHNGVVGEFTSIAVSANGSVSIAYYDLGNRSLKYAHLVGAQWQIETVDDPVAEVGEYASLALDASGSPHITYFDLTNGCLKYAYKTSTGWTIASLAVTTGAAGPNDLVLNSTGVPYVAYTSLSTHILSVAHLGGSWVSDPLTGSPQAGIHVSMGMDENDVQYVTYMGFASQVLVRAMNATGSWSYSTIDSTLGAGLFNSMTIDGNQKIQVAYLENGRLKYATNAGASWYVLPADDAGSRGDLNCIATDPLGDVHLAYRDGATDNLLYAIESATGVWNYAVIDGTGHVDGTHNIAMAVDAQGKAYVLYHDSVANSLKFATNSAGAWVNDTIYGTTATAWTILVDAQRHCHVFLTTTDDHLYYGTNSPGWSFAPIASGTMAGTPSAVMSPDGKFHVVYQTATSVNYTTSKTGTWTTSVVEDSQALYGGRTSLAIDPAGMLHAVFYDTFAHTMTYAVNGSGGWTTQNIESAFNGDWCSIGIGTDGVLKISYYWNGELRFLTMPEGVWMKQTVKTGAGAVGSGMMALTATGRAAVGYYDYTTPGRMMVAERISLPSAPATIAAVRGNGVVQLNWTAPSDNGGALVTSYAVYRGQATNNLVFVAKLTATHTGYLDSGLVNGVKYYYAVKAANYEGAGLRSSMANATPATVPLEPRNLVIAPGSGEIKLSWDAPSFNGGAPIAHYSVYRGTDSTNLTLVGNSTVTTYTDGGLQNDKTYYYKVTAVNAVGEGAQSSLGQGTPKVDNTLLIVGIAVLVIAAAGAALYVAMRRRR